ncbi:MAG: TolC family protein [Bacteroidales bacterium]|jgi:outer membrane protein
MLKLRVILLHAACMVAGIFTVNAQDAVNRLTLDEALMIAHAQSSEALIAKHRFRMNYWEFRSFKADYLPGVNVDAVMPTFSRSYRTISVPDGPDIFQYNTLGNYAVRMSIDQKVGFTGGTIFLQSRLQRLDNYYTDSTYTNYQSTPIIIGYRQPIFKYNEYRWSRKIEPLKYEKAKREYIEDIEQVSVSTVNHFFNLLLAQVEREIAQKNLYSYDTLYRIALGRYQLGKIAENELLQLELNFLRAKASVDNADLNYENMLFRLKSFLRIKDNQPIVLIPPADTRHKVVSAAAAIEEAKKNTSTALEFQERLLTAESQVNRAKMNGRFDADLYIEYGLTQSTADIGEVYSNPLDQQQLNLGISVPVLDWGKARGQIKVAESNLELVETSVEQEIIDYEQSIFLNVMQFNMQKDQLFIAAKADTVAQKRYDVTQRRYMIGQVNDVLELNNAQIDNDNARKGYYQALRSYWNNYFQLRKMTLYDFMDEKMLIFNIRDIM